MAATNDQQLATDSDTAALQRLLDGRWSCRAFLPDPVSQTLLDTALDLARRAPSWCNTQPWHVLLTRGEGTERFREALSVHAADGALEPDFAFPERYTGEYDKRRKETAWQLYEKVGVARGDRAASAAQSAKNFSLFGAPHAAVITTEANLGVYGAVDCGLYVQTLLLAFQGLGLGAIPQAAIASQSKFIREYFDLPDNKKIVCGISFGWPDLDHPANDFRTKRVSAQETVTWVD